MSQLNVSCLNCTFLQGCECSLDECHYKGVVGLRPYLNVVVDLGVEVDQENEGSNAQDEESGPVVVVDGIIWNKTRSLNS